MCETQFSLVCPIKNESSLIPLTLPTFYAVKPSEVILCFDNPPHAEAFKVAKEISLQRPEIPTTFLLIDRNKNYKFQQAWIRRKGFLTAKHDRILTTDIDLLLNSNVRKAVTLVGKNNVGLVSLAKMRCRKGLVGEIRNIMDKATRFYASISNLDQAGKSFFTGLYGLYRPFWLDSEDNGIKSLVDPKQADLDLDAWGGYMGEDTYLRDCMMKKHSVLYLADVGATDLRPGLEDTKVIQIKIGRKFASQGSSPFVVMRHSIAHIRPYVLGAYIHDANALGDNVLRKILAAFFQLAIQVMLQLLRKVIPIKRGIGKRFNSNIDIFEYRHEFLVSLLTKKIKGKIFVDVGGGIGYYSMLLKNNFDEIYVFEPDIQNYEKIRENFEKNCVNAKVECKAVSDSNGYREFYKTDPSTCGSLVGILGPYTSQCKTAIMQVEAVSLATYFKNVERIDLVKVDVEGAEWLVLHGAEPLMDRINRWVIELHNLEQRTKLQDFLAEKNYKWKWVDQNHIYVWRMAK